MKGMVCCLFCVAAWATSAVAAPPDVDPDDPLLRLGCLDVTKAPYRADPTGRRDCTQAIQRAVQDARDHWLACFFPEGTYLISDTISCEQQVHKLDRPRRTDRGTQHYWDRPNRIVLLGSVRGKRPLLKLAAGARGFDNPAKPKMAVWIWAQTRDDAPGKDEPQWGKEQPNISFSHIFRGIDIDVRSHAGAIGLRHSGSQGSTIQDATILAEGAYAGLSNCCGQGGGTYNVEVVGGRYGMTIDRSSRFPLLTACVFRGQTDASICYTQKSQMPTLLVACRLAPAGRAAVDLTRQSPHAGISMVDCVAELPPGGVLCRTRNAENVFLENTYVRGARAVDDGAENIPAPEKWTHIKRYSACTRQGVHLIDGRETAKGIADWQSAPVAPAFDAIRKRHYSPTPSFEGDGVVNVRAHGAKGDGTTDDTAAFRKAIAAGDKVYVPKGNYRLSGTLTLRSSTHLFGLAGALSSIGDAARAGRQTRRRPTGSFTLATPDDAAAQPGLSFLSVRGRIDWRSGKGTCMLAPGVLTVSGHGGGRFYGVMARGGSLVLKGLRRPTAFYALNVERKGTNPQSLIEDCEHLRVYFFKVEAGTVNRPNAGDNNTPCRIAHSRDIRVYCMYGVVRKLGSRPMLDVADSRDVLVAQLKTFSPGTFPHLTETFGQQTHTIPSSKTCALFVRNADGR